MNLGASTLVLPRKPDSVNSSPEPSESLTKRSRLRHVGSTIGVLLVIMLSGCNVLKSSKVDTMKPGPGFGGYSLPKTLVRVTIIEDPDVPGRLSILERPSCRPDVLTGAAKTATAVETCGADPLQTTKVPDPNHLYQLDYLESASSTDDVKVELTSKGFLDKVTVSAEEQTQTVLKTVAQIAFTLISGVPSTTTPTGTPRALRADGVTEVPPKYRFDGFVDPTATKEEIDPINRILPASYRLESIPVGGDPFSKASSRGEGDTGDQTGSGETMPDSNNRGSCVTGVCYRPSRPYVLRLVWKDPASSESSPRPVAAYLLLVENSSPIFEVPVGRSAFVDRDTTLDFNEGQLTSIHVKKPSELVQLVAWPLDILNAFFELPAKIFQFRFDNTKSQVALVQQQKALADAYADLIESRRALLALQSADTPKESDQTVGGGGNPPRVGQ